MIWVVNTAIALGLTAILYRTLTRKNGASGESAVDRRRLNAAIYQERLEEVESDLARGAISEASFEQMKADLQETFVKDVEREEREKSNETALPPFYLKALLLVLPSIMLALYFFMAYNLPLRDWNRAKVQIQPLIDQMLAGENIDHEALKAFELSTFVRVLQSHLQVHPEKRGGGRCCPASFVRTRC